MFILIVGSLSSGRTEIVKYLTQFHQFQALEINADSDSQIQKFTFPNATSLINHVTLNWKFNFVLKSTLSSTEIDELRKRPFVLVVGIDGPVKMRFQRFCSKRKTNETLENMQEFIDVSDKHLYGFSGEISNSEIGGMVQFGYNTKTINDVIRSSDLMITNSFNNVEELYKHLDSVSLINVERTRPSWDLYFMKIAELASHRSNCMKRRVGCILVQNRQIIATGYNGTPKRITNCNEGGCKRCNEGASIGQSLDLCLCLHAEENALLEVGSSRISSVYCTLYCNTCPCIGCAKKIVQTGVREVVYSKSYGMDSHTSKLFEEAGIIMRQYNNPLLYY
ncbi:hypothetical protein BB559_001911 [Furculomyces boomerangus]|uniref:Deoxycytidylate deaminase n=2 Tax=Harpellales TaxID=61421 RepID=A0A2T9YZM4_9FUNG|nr:hypothetical protein BB559_001911 [Furculomyces boomerangus]PWA02275.1 hypothetical protein BB558_001591 [Smittium angustum]